MERDHLAARIAAYRSGVSGANPVIEETDPSRFMAQFAGAAAGGGNIFLANPSWRAKERAELYRLSGMGPSGERGWLMVPSGGSGGSLKFARHDGWTIAAAVGGFCSHFCMERVNSVCVLPLHHVSGFAAWMRSALTGGEFIPWSWKDAEAGHFPRELPVDCCLSLVPTQLHRLMSTEAGSAWLRKFRVVFIGGAAAWEQLVEGAARLELPLSTSYGATETLAMVAALKPEQFLAGIRGCGTPLPHARFDIVDGVIKVGGDSIFRGYFPDFMEERTWTTGDLGVFDNGSLVVLGRRDDAIITGGKKVSPAEVEAALMASGEFEDVAVIGLPDPEWGQSVVACHPGSLRPVSQGALRAALSGLESYKHPKRFVIVSPWPRNPQGKIDRRLLLTLASGT